MYLEDELSDIIDEVVYRGIDRPRHAAGRGSEHGGIRNPGGDAAITGTHVDEFWNRMNKVYIYGYIR